MGNFVKKLKDIFHNNWIGCLVFLLLSAWIWTKALHISQNYLITNKNWYATKSKMITNNMMGATAASMSRSAIAGGQINLRHLYGGNEVNFVRGIQFSSLKFDFQVPQNSYLDVTFNITDKTMTAFRISRSSIFPSMSYHATREGKFLTVNSFHIDLSGKGLGRGEIRQTPEGIEFKIDGRRIGLIEGDSILPAEFGFRSGLRGAFVSNVEVKDVSGIKINTELENNKDFWLHFGGHLIAIVVICAFVAGLVWLIRKTPLRRTVFIASSFLFFSGSLWYSFDDYYFARQESDWSKDDEATYRFRNPMSFDFEIYRYKFFAGWKKLWNERPMTLETFVSRYGQSVDEPTYHYCLNERCVHLSEREALSASAKNDKPTLRFGLIGASFSAGSGVINADDSFFVVAHKKVYESYKGQFNIESINYSKTKFSYTKDFISTFELAKKIKSII